MDDRERLSDWLRGLLGLFADLDQSDREALSGGLEDICPPCQVDAVWFAAPDVNVNCQVLVFSRFADIEHGLVTVHGPAHPSQAADILNTLGTDPKWQRPITGRFMFALKDPSYSRLLEMPIGQALAHIKRAVLTRAFQQAVEAATPGRQGAFRLTEDVFYWICAGNLAEHRPEDVANGILEEARQRAPSAKGPPERPAEPEPTTEPGFGTYLYPPVWIGELPRETTEQRLRRSFQDRYPMGLSPLADEAVASTYKGTRVVVMQDGFVAITQAERQEALRRLNELIAAFLLSGLPSHVVRDHELSEVGFQNDRITRRNDPIISMRTAWGTGAMAMFEATPESLEWTRAILSVKNVRRVLAAAKRISSVDVPSVLFLLESYTAFEDSEFPQSYIMSWAVIEGWIVAKWQAFLKRGRGVSGQRLNKLTGSHLAWTVDHYLETLNLAGEIDNERYSSLMSLKSKRNKLLHQRKLPSPQDAATALQTAEALLRELLPVQVKPFLGGRRRGRPKPFTASAML